MKRLLGHIKTYIFRGFLAIVPFALAFFAIHLLYTSIDQRVMDLIDRAVGFTFPGLGLLLVIITLYVLGFVASNVLGRQILNLVERVTGRIPLVKTVYQIGKQLADTLSLPGRHVFKRAVMVDCLRPGAWVIGFVTGTVNDRRNNETLLKVYVPFPPNPTSGIVVFLKESETRDPGWSVENALKAVMSGGIIGPTEIR